MENFNNTNKDFNSNRRINEADENKKYIFKVAVIACAIVFVLIVGAGLLAGLFLFIKSKSDLDRMVNNYKIYNNEVYIRHGDKIVREMVENYGADVNETDISNRSPLFIAVTFNNIKAVKYLLEKKADPEIANNEGTTPLVQAIKENNKKIAELLLKEGKANIYGSYTGNILEKYPMYCAVSMTNKEMVRLLLDNSFELKREPSLLNYAIANSDENIVKYLIDNGANINYKDAEGITILYNAVLSLNPSLVDYFLSKNASISDAGVSDIYGNIIMAAAGAKFNNSKKYPVDLVLLNNSSASSAKITEKLFKYDIDKKIINSMYNGKNALIIAAGNSYIETVKLLLQNGADINAEDSEGLTSLMYAANNGDIELAKVLIENKANVNAKDNKDQTALLYAMNSPIISSKNDMIKLLINNKANINAVDSKGFSPLTIAVMNNDTELIKLLIANKANLSVVTKDGESLIEYAINNDNVDLLQILVENGADINFAGTSSYTPLMIASKTGAENIVRILLTKKVDLNAVDKYGNTALHIAAESSKLPIVRMLLEKKPKLNIQNEDGDTALHKAAVSGDINIVSEIVLSGADVMIRNNYGKYPINIAEANNNSGIFEILKEAQEKQNNISNINQ